MESNTVHDKLAATAAINSIKCNGGYIVAGGRNVVMFSAERDEEDIAATYSVQWDGERPQEVQDSLDEAKEAGVFLADVTVGAVEQDVTAFGLTVQILGLPNPLESQVVQDFAKMARSAGVLVSGDSQLPDVQ